MIWSFSGWNRLHVSFQLQIKSCFFPIHLAQDAPSHVAILVVCCKGNDNSFCTRCFYIKRGSLGKLTCHDCLCALYGCPALMAKSLGQWTGFHLKDSELLQPFLFLGVMFTVHQSHSSLRFMALRKKMVQAVAANPSARPRHEVLNVALYIEKKKTSFMEFYQVGSILKRLLRLDCLSQIMSSPILCRNL